jgi:hypothetical protein
MLRAAIESVKKIYSSKLVVVNEMPLIREKLEK